MCCVNRTRTLFWLLPCVLLAAGAAHGQTTYYVNDDGTSMTCTGWGDACPDLQTALGLVVSGDQIWVAAGTYNPTSGADRTATFQLITGVAIYGGFDGTESTLGERAGLFDQTILSGDIGTVDDNFDNSYHVLTGSGTDATAVLDGFTITGGNANPVDPLNAGSGMYNVAGSPTVTNCTFSGNRGGYEGLGGGMHNFESSPTLTNCTFSGNSAGHGGGMHNWEYSIPTLTNCTFSGNSAYYSGGGMGNHYNSSPTLTNCTFSGNTANNGGGGMYNRSNSSPTVVNCTFSGNTADNGGGGMSNYYNSSPTVTNCTFSGNTGSYDYAGGGMDNRGNSNPIVTNCTFSGNSASGGGGMHNWEFSSPTLTNCTFSGNLAYRSGGGMANLGDVLIISSPTLTNCTFSGNIANNGGGMANYYNSNPTLTNCTFSENTANGDGGGMINADSSPTVTNCILWGDSPDEIFNDDPAVEKPTVSYSDVQDDNPDDGVVYPGTGNIDDDPLFVDADGPDDVPGTEDDNLRLSTNSPCIDTGDNTGVTVPTDLDGNPRILDGDSDGTAVVDMGAYESLPDCNENGIPDMCDLDCDALSGDCDVPGCGLRSDENANGVPDECDCPELDPPTQPAGEAGYEKARYISMVPGNPGRLTALRVHLKDLPAPFDVLNCTKCWVGQPATYCENSGVKTPPCPPTQPTTDFMGANLQGSPHCMDWSTVGVLHVTDDDIVPAAQPPGGVFDPAIYDVHAIDCECDFENEANYSAPLTITTSKWGDLVGTCAVIPCTPPEGIVNMATDVTACFDKFRNLVGAVLKSRADVEPNFPDGLVNISDCTFELDAFRGFAYPAAQTPPAPGWPGPDGCP